MFCREASALTQVCDVVQKRPLLVQGRHARGIRSAMSEKRTVKVVLQQMKTCRSYILINREQVSDKKGQTKCENTGARPVSVG